MDVACVVLASVVTSSMELHLLDGRYKAGTGSRCLDGSMAGFYYRRASRLSAELRWVIYLQGGGLCYDPDSCHSRAQTSLGSSKYWSQSRMGSGPQSASALVNPDFYDAHQLYIPYCSGDLHTGTLLNRSVLSFNLYFSGHEIIEAVIDQVLREEHGLNIARDVLLSGDSAGGMGTIYNVDWLAGRLPWASVRGAPIGGWFFSGDTDDKPDARWAPPTIYPEWIEKKKGASQLIVGYLIALYSSFLHENCVKREQERFHCGTAHVMYHHVKSPLFVLQNMYDTNQIGSELFMPGCSGDSCTPNQRAYVEYFGRSVRNSTRQIIRDHPDRDGLFLPSCYAHTAGISVGGETRIADFGPTEMLGDWFFHRAGRAPRQLVDDCIFSANETLPCNPTCANMVPKPVPPAPPPPETPCEEALHTVCTWNVGCLACATLHFGELKAAGCTWEQLEQYCKEDSQGYDIDHEALLQAAKAYAAAS